ncbi:hypothetical protein F6455_09505 [Proteobacteria bacterium 005FR1]|nr:hypothetical protein [Proteobacteria bacterium 005FR1]
MPVISRDGEVLSGHEIGFLSTDEDLYPQLTRLFFDFNFRVVAIPAGENSSSSQYLVTFGNVGEDSLSAITPAFASLDELESYTNENIIDILHQTLFSGLEDEF